jgi:hypothetical protein
MSVLRRESLSEVDGEILKIGFGTGLNLEYYPEHVRHLTAVDPDVGVSRLDLCGVRQLGGTKGRCGEPRVQSRRAADRGHHWQPVQDGRAHSLRRRVGQDPETGSGLYGRHIQPRWCPGCGLNRFAHADGRSRTLVFRHGAASARAQEQVGHIPSGGIAFLQRGDRMLSAAQLSPPTRQLEAKVWNASPWPGKS